MKRRTFSLQTLLIVSFVLQVVGITGLVGYLSYRSGQRTVVTLANQILEETGNLVTQDLNGYLQIGHQINQAHIAAVQVGALSTENLEQLHQFLILQLLKNQSTTSLLFGSPEGDFRFINRVYPEVDFGPSTNVQPGELPYEAGVSAPGEPPSASIFSVDDQGQLLHQVEIIQNVDVRLRPWYRQAVAKGQPGWSTPFQIGRSEILAINAFAPFYDDTNQLQGVFSVNFSLRWLDQFLKSLSISQEGYAFIVDRDGLIIANSFDQPAYIATSSPNVQSQQTVFEPGKVNFERLSALSSNHPILQKTALQLQDQFGSWDTIQSAQDLTVMVKGNRHFLRVIPYQDDYGLDWLIVVGIPKAVFAADIQDNARRTLLLSSIALVGAIGSGIWATRRVTRSLTNLIKATQNVAAGQLDQPIQASQIQEFEELSAAFRQMVTALRQGAELQHNYQRDLEARVAETTTALNEAQRIAQLGCWTLDVATQTVTWSSELLQIFGVDPNQPPPSNEECWLMIHAADRTQMQATLETTIATGKPYFLEYRVVRPSAEIRYVLGRGEAVTNAEGHVAKVIGTVLDITERKLAEINLHLSKTRLKIITDSIPGCISYVDADQRYRFVNRTYETWFSLRREDILGRTVKDVIGPESYARARAHIEATLRGETITYEMTLPYQGNPTRYVSGVLVPDFNDQNEVNGYYALITDITERKQLERALQASEQKTQEIFNSALAAIASMRVFENGTWTIDRVSAGCEALTGFTAEEMTVDDHLWIEHILPEDWQAYREDAFTNIFAEQTGTYEYRFRHKNGSIRWFSQITNSVRDEAQRCWVVTATSVDITDLKQAEARLQEQENLLRAIGDNMPKGFVYQFMHEPDRGFYFNYVSAGIERVTGLKPAEVMGNFNALGDLILPEDRQMVEQAYQDSLEHLSLFEVDMRKRTLGGELQWSTVRSTPYRLEDGRTVWYGIELDITNLKKTEAALRENEELFRRAFEDAPIGMALVSLDGRLLRVNQALSQIYGYSTDELVCMSVPDISAPEDLARDMALSAQVLAGEIQTYQLEKRFIHKQGHTVYGLLNVSLLRDEQQRPLYFVTQVQDISERRKIEKMKRDFVSIVSHELRTPLTSMRGALGILETGVLKDRPEKAQHMMSVAIQNSDRLIRLVNNILDLERLESGQVSLVKEPCPIGKLMDTAAESLESIAENASITLAVAPIDQVILLAPDAILQTLTNLLSNAIKFSVAGDTVWLTAEVTNTPHPPASPHPPHPPHPLPRHTSSSPSKTRGEAFLPTNSI
jgi:PAS domain S-box-containing protein